VQPGKDKFELDPNYVTGFSDGEACFHLAIGKNSKLRVGYYVNPGFSIVLHKKDEELLREIQKFFGGIGVFKVKKDIVQFRVFSVTDLSIILEHFDKYPLITKKYNDYMFFKEALELIKNKEHLTVEGFNKILSLRASINNGLPEVLKLAFPDIKERTISSFALSERLNPYWVAAGFTDAEGCFFIKIRKDSAKNMPGIIIGFQVSQHIRDDNLIKELITFFSCGRLESSEHAIHFVVTRLSAITEIIIPFFENYPIFGSKARDLADWKK
jgi:hypothetical protein